MLDVVVGLTGKPFDGADWLAESEDCLAVVICDLGSAVRGDSPFVATSTVERAVSVLVATI